MELKKERTTMKVAAIDLNEGQWPWLPKNPRQWTQTDIDKTAASIEEDPDFLEDRPLLVIASPEKGRYIAFGGNLRLTACRQLKRADVPVVVYQLEEFGAPAVRDVIRETIKRRAMKDNGSFGSWDFDELANNWDDLPLGDWGVKAWPAPENPNQGEGKPAPSGGSRAAGNGDVHNGPFVYAVKVELPTLEEQLAFLEEMQGRGYEASVI